MSFSVTTKNELARILAKKKCCQMAELAALVKMDGHIQLNSGNLSLNILTENAAVARKIIIYLKSLFGIHTETLMRKKARLKKNNTYMVRVPPTANVRLILKTLGIMAFDENRESVIKEKLLAKDCCRRAYLRGIFLGGGSVNNPEGNYHLEIITNNEDHAVFIVDIMKKYNLNAKMSTRKNWYVIYLKGSEEIIKLLNIMGAHSALLNFENIRIYKDMRNQVNRLVNCETANLNKTVNAAVRQIENIKLIADTVGLDKLPATLREVAEQRLAYPDVSLKELGEMMEPKVTKSGINHRIRKIEKIAEKIKEKRFLPF